jgi:hypothetical protein
VVARWTESRLAVKDIFETRGLATEFASSLAGRKGQADAA